MIEFTVVGIWHRNEDGVHRQSILRALHEDCYSEGGTGDASFRLVAEDDNPHDGNAVSVWVSAFGGPWSKVGYVPADLALDVRDTLKRLGDRSRVDFAEPNGMYTVPNGAGLVLQLCRGRSNPEGGLWRD